MVATGVRINTVSRLMERSGISLMQILLVTERAGKEWLPWNCYPQ